jgi:hypothetical protein
VTHDHRTTPRVWPDRHVVAEVTQLVVTAAERWYDGLADPRNPFLDDEDRALLAAVEEYREHTAPPAPNPRT